MRTLHLMKKTTRISTQAAGGNQLLFLSVLFLRVGKMGHAYMLCFVFLAK
jgi:hypothetical protein